MKITKLTTYRLPPRWMFLKIETDEGVIGWGEPVIEGRARTVEAAVHELGAGNEEVIRAAAQEHEVGLHAFLTFSLSSRCSRC